MGQALSADYLTNHNLLGGYQYHSDFTDKETEVRVGLE